MEDSSGAFPDPRYSLLTEVAVVLDRVGDEAVPPTEMGHGSALAVDTLPVALRSSEPAPEELNTGLERAALVVHLFTGSPEGTGSPGYCSPHLSCC